MWVSTEIRLPRLTIAGRSLHEPLDNQIDLPLSPYIISNIPNVGKHEKRNLMKIKYITTQPRIIHLTKIKQMKNHNNAMKTKTLKKTPSVLAIITTIAACGGGPIQETNSTLQKQSETPISQTPSPLQPQQQQQQQQQQQENQNTQQETTADINHPNQSIINTIRQATDNYLKDINYSNNGLYATGVDSNLLIISTTHSGHSFVHLNKEDLISKFKSNCQITGQPWIDADAHNCFSGIYFGKLEVWELDKPIKTGILCYTSMSPDGTVRHGYENNIYPEEKFSHGVGAYLFKTNSTNDTHLIYSSSTLQMGPQWPGFEIKFSWDTMNGEISFKRADSYITQGQGKRCHIW